MNRKIFFALLLICAGALSFVALTGWKTKLPVADPKAIRASVVKGFTLLQKSGVVFIAKAKCASCHHAAMTSMVAETMIKKGITGFDTTRGLRIKAMTNTLAFQSNPNLNDQFIPAKFLAPYILLGLQAEGYPADFNTDLAVEYLLSQALPDGSFKAECARVPLECGDVHLTAFATRAIQLYASPSKGPQVQQLVTRTKGWLERQTPTVQQELAFQLLGLTWCGSSVTAKTAVVAKLKAMQNSDGGWSQLPAMSSDAYATGQVLYALSQAGLSHTESETYEKGINYLLRTQDKSGAWIVTTRSNPIQLLINTDFPPYDENQFISAAATNWAALALAEALPDKN
jgi:hypothetical protein